MNTKTSDDTRPSASERIGPTLVLLLALGAALLLGGCLERPVCGDCKPGTSNVFVKRVPINKIAKVDLLFVVDNSASMADKQALMKQAVPAMLNRLVTPNCVTKDPEGNVVQSEPGNREGGAVHCPTDMSLEFQPISDIHIGVITSSLGSHGYIGPLSCDEPGKALPEKNDRARLIPLVRPLDPSVAGQDPFLSWKGGTEDASALGNRFADHIGAAGEAGCGLEATHEAWYRFLVDPEPPSSMSIGTDGPTKDRAVRGPIDEELLELRRKFLRPDSLVAIVVLTDENDCSAMDGGTYYDFADYGYLPGVVGTEVNGMLVPSRNAEPTDICETDPNNKCCQTCIDRPNSGCESHFAKCPEPLNAPRLPAEKDQNNLRCFQNQRRFGFDLLYPVTRYIDGLSQTQVRGANGDLLPNPLVAGRTPGLIYFAGITGVPWQDLATPETLNNPNELKYLTARDLKGPVDIEGTPQGYTYWDLILGTPGKHAESNYCKERSNGDGTFQDEACGIIPVNPRDPFMVESIEPRTARKDLITKTNERAQVTITDGPTWNTINGHEYDTAAGEVPNKDLQYSCIFPLGPFGAEKTQEECDANPNSCDCTASSENAGKPLCKAKAGGEAGGGQFWGKAYPSTRTLEILKGFGDNSIAASICPKVTDAKNQDYYGYTPAVSAIIDRLKETLQGQCLPRALTVSEMTEEVPCVVVEARAKPEGDSGTTNVPDLDCELSGRIPATPKVRKAVLAELEKAGSCFFEDTPDGKREGKFPCESYQMCSIRQFSKNAPERDYCLNSVGADSGSPGEAGYCYIDKNQGNPQLLDECPANEKRKLRFVYPQSVPTPQNSTVLFYACVGEATTGE